MGGKSTGGTSSDTKYTLAPEQQEVLTDAMHQYVPGGRLPESAPTFDYNTNPELQWSGGNYVASFSPMQRQAFGITEATAGSNEPTMGAAQGVTADVANAPANFGRGVATYMDPYTERAIGGSLDIMNQQRKLQLQEADNNAVMRGSFGGTRQAVGEGLVNQNFDLAEANMISQMENTSFQNATQEFNAINQQRLAAANQYGNQALQMQTLEGNDINALSAAGGQVQQNEQARRDAARAAQMQNATYGMTVADAIAGLSPPPSSSTNTTNYTSPGSIWSNIGGGAVSGLMMMSDEEAKTDIRQVDPEDALSKIRKLIPKTFSYKPDVQDSHGVPAGTRTGFMAQDLEKATGKPNPRDGAGYQHVDMNEHVMRLTHAVQALDAKMRDRYGGQRKRAA